MLLSSYPAQVVEDYVDADYRDICERMNGKVYNETIQEIKRQASDPRTQQEDYFDGLDAIAKTYGLTEVEMINKS